MKTNFFHRKEDFIARKEDIFIKREDILIRLELAILNALTAYYKEYKDKKGLGPVAISKELDIFRGTQSGKDKMKMNDAIVTGFLLDLINHNKVKKLEHVRGEYVLSDVEAEKRGLLK